MADDTMYSNWSQADLIRRVTELEQKLKAQNANFPTPSTEPSPEHVSLRAPSPTLRPKPKKRSKAFDPSKYSTRLIAIKFAYLGQRYNGYEHHLNNTTPLPTIEEELWRALMKTRLIMPTPRRKQSSSGSSMTGGGREDAEKEPWEADLNWEGCEYSKCGRTDKGVSAFGQVIGIRVRSNRPLLKQTLEDERVEEAITSVPDPGNAKEIDTGGLEVGLSSEDEQEAEKAFDHIKDELPYIHLLNRVLPPDIRVLAWCPSPPEGFSARFSCKERRYKYFFTNPAFLPAPGAQGFSHPAATGKEAVASKRDGWLDITAMQEAASYYVGLNDFRNFCKVDPSKQITNFERRIFHASIEEVSTLDIPSFVSAKSTRASSRSSPVMTPASSQETSPVRSFEYWSPSDTAKLVQLRRENPQLPLALLTPRFGRSEESLRQRLYHIDPSHVLVQAKDEPDYEALMEDWKKDYEVWTAEELDILRKKTSGVSWSAIAEELNGPNKPGRSVHACMTRFRRLLKGEEGAGRMKVYAFSVNGSAFLWHQVRHLVAVLFLVGQGLEKPEVVRQMLDVQKCPTRPVYEMASDAPLVLWDCVFPAEGSDSREDALDWVYVGDEAGANLLGKSDFAMKWGRMGVMEDLWQSWRSRKIDEVLAGLLVDRVAEQGKTRLDDPDALPRAQQSEKGTKLFFGGDGYKPTGQYVPLMKRRRMESVETINARYAARKGLDQQTSISRSPADVVDE
ncbi:hypothetical protein LTS18_009283 [Coniosporium uncinatum]|uniref:Uncharacterized protein n=1 Tax=Coniosporium uncinatum TaxID=93489 RepID=A0ACC3DD41_9PEZI|nr:hypothetical protein LTS18_009283 [Coniosporium uncinatum]